MCVCDIVTQWLVLILGSGPKRQIQSQWRGSMGRNSTGVALQDKTWVLIRVSWEDPLEKEMATNSSTLA